ncbi:MarR family winged helix-turn-helix transcriptional regulator [Actinophytocola gossypii]|uniref:MarR family transcriptional regulator n=1 Tax=Actinophytocola gossypii TaxID=2812003 RepID=A0ABT2JBP2_9PSEU|nr:MarR family transcriptional regulator [Actinophytocola gossypii]MCT2585267.1 MarR family transcriptional regulator [Actinophytocola gossypii]
MTAKLVWDRFYEASRASKLETERRLSAHGVHIGQQFVLECLWDEDGLTPTELARRIGVEPATLTRLLRRMEDAGLVLRRDDEQDKRRIRTWLTEHGAALRDPVHATIGQLQRDAVRLLTEDETATFAALLAKMTTGLRGQ